MEQNPARPLKDAAHESFVRVLLQPATAGNQTVAYMAAYPGTSSNTARCQGALLKAKPSVRARYEFLQNKAAERAVLTREKYLALLTRAADNCALGVGQFIEVTPGGGAVVRVTGENKHSLALKSLKSRVERRKSGASDDELVADILDVEARDFLPYGQEIAKMQGWYPKGDGGAAEFEVTFEGPRSGAAKFTIKRRGNDPDAEVKSTSDGQGPE